MALSALSFPLHLRQTTPSDPKTSTPLALPSSHSHWGVDLLTQSLRRHNQVRTCMSIIHARNSYVFKWRQFRSFPSTQFCFSHSLLVISQSIIFVFFCFILFLLLFPVFRFFFVIFKHQIWNWTCWQKCWSCFGLIQVRKMRHGVCASLSETGEYHSKKPPTPLLDTINYPIHMKNLSTKVQLLKTQTHVCDLCFILCNRKEKFMGVWKVSFL